MNNDFLRAAASYYGLSLDQVQQDSEIDTSTGEFVAVMRILMTPEDLIGVAQRMKVMREEEAQRQLADPAVQEAIVENETIRAEYNDLSSAEKSKYGSFARFRAGKVYDEYIAAGSAPLNRKVEHINAPEDTEPTDMRAVWIPFADATTAQRNYANDSRPSETVGTEYLVQWAMLTEEQKAQVADRSGGLPG